MTNEQADNLAEAVANADHGCVYCVHPILEALIKIFPEHDWYKLGAKHNEWYSEAQLRSGEP